MRRSLFLPLLLVVPALTRTNSTTVHEGGSGIGSDPKGIAVVELFTSEGCSSCPPADRVLMDLLQRVRSEGRAVFPLSFHVDYWNRLGWKDPFSAKAWSDRQYTYATRTGDGVYTPQCVVNGRHSFVGSDSKVLDQWVQRALDEPAVNTISATIVEYDGGFSIDVRVSGPVSGREIVACLVEDGLHQEVSAGENRGRTLEHANVVRSMAMAHLSPDVRSQNLSLEVGDPVDRSRVRVILFVQATGQGAITGAISLDAP